MVGRSLGPYRLVELVGAGGMGHVYRAEHALLERSAAVKVLLPELAANDNSVQRFFREATLTATLKHPGLVEVYDFGTEDDGTAYLAMELLEGETLSARLKRLRRLSPEVASRLAAQISGTLATTHDAGVVHRDLKPSNVIVVQDPDIEGGERTKLLDFGVAKLVEGEQDVRLTISGALIGTPVFMSPEQCNGSKEVSAPADIYSLGCILFSMLAGRPPFVCDAMGEYIVAHCTREPPPLPSASMASTELRALIKAMLAKAPSERPTAVEVRTALESIPLRGEQSGWFEGDVHDGATEIDSATRGTGVADSVETARPTAPRKAASGNAPAAVAATVPAPRNTYAAAPVALPTPRERAPVAGRPVWMPIAGVALALTALVGLIVALSGGDGESQTTALESDAAPTIAAPSPNDAAAVIDGGSQRTVVKASLDASALDAAPAKIRVVVRSSPADAAVALTAKGAELGTTPYVLERPAADFPLTVWLRKRGHYTRKVVVSPDDDATHKLRKRRNSDPLGHR